MRALPLHEPPLTYTSQIHTCCHQSSTGSFAGCKTARNMSNCQWQMEVCTTLPSNLRTDTFWAPERNGIFPRTVVASGERIAVKIQLPNMAESMASHQGYIRMALTAERLLPRGLFLDKTLTVLYSAPCHYKPRTRGRLMIT